MRHRGRRSAELMSIAIIAGAPILATITAVIVTLHAPITARANSWGNYDQLEAGPVLSDVPGTQACFQSPLWGSLSPTPCVSQRYGCTDLAQYEESTKQSGVPAWATLCKNLGCPDINGHDWCHWHHGIDLSVPSGTAIYSPVTGTVVDWNQTYAALGIQMSTGQVVYLLHGSPAAGIGVGSAVTRGQHVYDSDNSGISTNSHLHFEVHNSLPGIVGTGHWDDINPEGWLKALAPGGSVTAWSSNRLDLFVRGQNFGFWHLPSSDGANWAAQWENHLSPTSPSGNTFSSQPVVVAWAPTRLDIFGVGALDYKLYHQYWDGTSWGPTPPPPLLPYQGWDPVPGQPAVQLLGNPAVTTWGTNRLDIFARDSTGQVWHTCWREDANRSNASWCGWESIGGVTATSDASAVSWAPNRIDVFVRDSNNAFRHQYCSGVCYGNWAAQWENHSTPPGTTFDSRPSLVSSDANSLDVFGVGANRNLYHRFWNGTSWNPSSPPWEFLGPYDVGLFPTRAPAVASWTRNRWDVFVVNANWNSRHLPYDSGLQTWEDHGGVFTSELAEISWGPNRLDVFGRGQADAQGNYSIWWQYWNGSSWNPYPDQAGKGWANLGGSAT